MLQIIKLFRPLNLLIIALTQYGLHYLVIISVLSNYGKYPTLNHFQFFCLVLATVLVAAAGYLVNDWYNTNVDSINNPEKKLLSTFSEKRILNIYLVLNILAFVIALYVAWQAGNIKLAFIHPMAAGLLWFYSYNYHKQLIVGNMIVAGLSAFTIVTVGIYEQIIFNAHSPSDMSTSWWLMILIFVYSYFAFIVSLIREIVKDMEDLVGDSAFHRKTLPIVIGTTATKWIVFSLLILLLMSTVYIQFQDIFIHHIDSFRIFIFATVQLPILYILWQLKSSTLRNDFRNISNLLKVLMVLGLSSMGLVYYMLR